MTDELERARSAILAPRAGVLGETQSQGRQRCIVLVMGPPVTSFELFFTHLRRIPLPGALAPEPDVQGGVAFLDEQDLASASQARSTPLGPRLPGVRIVPASEPLLRALSSRGSAWCAYPEGFVLAALPHVDVPVLFQEVDREVRLAARRARYRQRKAARGFGEQLRRALWEGEASGLLAELVHQWEVAGWLAGLCWICAEGLLGWVTGSPDASSYEPRLMILASEDKQADHVVLQVGPWFLDGEGVSSLRALLHRHRTLEGLVRPHLLPYDERRLSEQGFPRDGEASRRLAASLASAFGPFSPALLGLPVTP